MSATIPDGDSFAASRWTKGNLWFPDAHRGQFAAREPRIKPRMFGSSEESISIAPGRFGKHFDRNDLVRHRDRVVWRHRSDHQPRPSESRRQRIRELIEGYQAARADVRLVFVTEFVIESCDTVLASC